MGEDKGGHDFARRNIDAFLAEEPDAIVINASGCGTTVKDYGYMFRNEPAYAEKARRVSQLARDVTELLAELGLPPLTGEAKGRVAYHSACSMQHGQRIREEPRELLAAAGFSVRAHGRAPRLGDRRAEAARAAVMPLVESSLIGEIEYDAEARLLYLCFHTTGWYVYADVPPDTYEELLAAPSKGVYFNDEIRGAFSEGKLAKGDHPTRGSSQRKRPRRHR
jgi:hypothetical protein